MKKYLPVVLGVLIGAIIVMLPYISVAQEAEEKAGAQEKVEEKEYSYGKVTNVDEVKNEIVVSEYDWETNADIVATYLVAPDAKFENAASLKEVKVDNEVSIEYIKKEDGTKVAKFISVHKPEAEPQTAEDAPEKSDLDLPDVEQ
jgi:hypothetical protein